MDPSNIRSEYQGLLLREYPLGFYVEVDEFFSYFVHHTYHRITSWVLELRIEMFPVVFHQFQLTHDPLLLLENNSHFQR